MRSPLAVLFERIVTWLAIRALVCSSASQRRNGSSGSPAVMRVQRSTWWCDNGIETQDSMHSGSDRRLATAAARPAGRNWEDSRSWAAGGRSRSTPRAGSRQPLGAASECACERNHRVSRRVGARRPHHVRQATPPSRPSTPHAGSSATLAGRRSRPPGRSAIWVRPLARYRARSPRAWWPRRHAAGRWRYARAGRYSAPSPSSRAGR